MTSTYPQESLAEALLALIRQQIAAFLIFWLLMNVPVICQYHSMMTPWDTSPDAHHGHTDGQDGQEQSHQSDCKLHSHESSVHLMSLLDAFVAIVPVTVVTRHQFKLTAYFVTLKVWPPELVIPPPERPPRSI